MIAVGLLIYGGLALYIGARVGMRLQRFAALMWAYDRVMVRWKARLDAARPSTRSAVRKRAAEFRAYRRVAREILDEAKKESTVQ